MRPSDDAGLTKAFWMAVVRCLEQFHAFGGDDARRAVADARFRLLDVPGEGISASLADMIYHAEPWHVAANIANDDRTGLSPAQHDQYREILKQTGLMDDALAARAGRARG